MSDLDHLNLLQGRTFRKWERLDFILPARFPEPSLISDYSGASSPPHPTRPHPILESRTSSPFSVPVLKSPTSGSSNKMTKTLQNSWCGPKASALPSPKATSASQSAIEMAEDILMDFFSGIHLANYIPLFKSGQISSSRGGPLWLST